MKWFTDPEKHDYAAAQDYLTLLVSTRIATDTVYLLKCAMVTHRKVKDILRASRLDVLPTANAHVEKNLDKIRFGLPLSPVLLVRTDRGLQIADGYHRVCAVYHFSEDEDIPCKLCDLAD